MRYFVILLWFCASSVYGQKLNYKAPKTGEVVVNDSGSVSKARVYLKNKKLKPRPDRYYHWYKSEKVFKTKGGFDGRLLHGVFAELYPDKNLKSKGKFRYGLKKGRWMSWYNNGELKKLESWSRGRKNGKFYEYAKDGSLKRSGYYNNDQLHGVVTEFEDADVKKYKYERGKLIKEIPVKNKAGKSGTKAKKETSDEPNKKEPFYKRGVNKVKQWFKKKDKPEKEKKEKEKASGTNP